MNPLTNVKNITKLNEIELSKGLVDKKSWHHLYKDSAWVFIGGLAYGLTEGDILAVFSQYGEIVNINLVRDKKTGKTKGFCFLCYANQKSTILAVDNFNGIKLCSRTIRVDHVSNYKAPKDNENDDDVTKQLKSEGCAPVPIKLETSPIPTTEIIPKKKIKKEKKKHKKNKKKDDNKYHHKRVKVKKEKHDRGYDKYEVSHANQESASKRRKVSENEASSAETSSSDSDGQEVNSHRRNKGMECDVQNKHYDQPGTSGFKESMAEKYEKRDSGRSHTSKDRTHFAHYHSKHDSSSQSSSNEISKGNSVASSRKAENSRKAYLGERQMPSNSYSNSSDSYMKERVRHQRDSPSDDDDVSTREQNSKMSEKSDYVRKHSRHEDSQYSNDKYYKNSKHKNVSSSEPQLNSRDYSHKERRSHSEEESEKYSKSSSKEYRKHKKDRQER